ncbi:UNVERIFIED_ORG: hypothetical protein J2X79_000223 [Arthrobacter globiformis]|nr:hypothetical protein [Arthrobacter globiformis]
MSAELVILLGGVTSPKPSPGPKPSTSAAPSSGGSASPDFWGPIFKVVVDAFATNVAQTWIALLALLLSGIAIFNQFSHGRKAQLSATFAKTPDCRGKADRLVIVNHGAAAAKDIKLTLVMNEDRNWKPYEHYGDPFPIEQLASGAAFYLELYVRPDQASASAEATITWKDKRWFRRQSWSSTVSTAGHLLGGPSLENFHKASQARSMDQLRSM